MGKKSTLSAEQRTQLVLRLMGNEEPAAQIARGIVFPACLTDDHESLERHPKSTRATLLLTLTPPSCNLR